VLEADDSSAEAGAADLARRLKAIREPPMRRVAMAEFLRDRPAAEVVATLGALVTLSRTRRDPAFTAALDALAAALVEAALVPYDKRAELYGCAKEVGQTEIARLFFDASPQTVSDKQVRTTLEPERAVVPRGRPLTLGERKALARCHRRELLQHVLRDPHPDVVAVVLGNPQLTERDVITIAARRPGYPDTLAEVATHPRWSVRYAVKRALVMNPHTPLHLSVRLATTLRLTDLRLVAADASLPEALRAQAAGLLA
jgi:hypothetical protein